MGPRVEPMQDWNKQPCPFSVFSSHSNNPAHGVAGCMFLGSGLTLGLELPKGQWTASVVRSGFRVRARRFTNHLLIFSETSKAF